MATQRLVGHPKQGFFLGGQEDLDRGTRVTDREDVGELVGVEVAEGRGHSVGQVAEYLRGYVAAKRERGEQGEEDEGCGSLRCHSECCKNGRSY